MDHRLTTEQEKGLKTVFSFFDKNGNGKIGSEEMGAALKALGYLPTDDEIQDMIQEVAKNHGSITFQEFTALMSEEDTEDDLKKMFRVFDRHNKGFISPSDLREVLIDLGMEITDHDIDEMIEEVDEDLNGHITFTEFTKIITSQ